MAAYGYKVGYTGLPEVAGFV